MSEPTPVRRRRWPIFAPFVLVVVLAAAWTGVWMYAARTAEQNIAAWMEQEAHFGRVYACTSRTLGGYPFRIELRCTDPVAEIKAAGVVFKAKEFVAVAQVYQPNLIIGEIAGPLSVAAPGQPPAITADWQLARASVRLTTVAPERISIVFDGAKIDQSDAGATKTVASASHIELHVRLGPASAQDKPVIEIAATVTAAALPGAGMLAGRPIDAEITALLRGLGDFTPKPLPVRLREWQAAGGRLEIANVRVKQGDAVAVAKGDLGLSVNGRVDGTLGITLAGFEQLLQAVVGGQGGNAGLFAAAGLSFLGRPAELDGKRAIAVPLRFNDGRVYLGPIPIGQTLSLF